MDNDTIKFILVIILEPYSAFSPLTFDVVMTDKV
jgi:hypothetical protein